jgi:8-amino-7-oxononanoate synthase
MERRLQEHLDRRRRQGTLRTLIPLPKSQHHADADDGSADDTTQLGSMPSPTLIDFASNDYLGLARCHEQHALVQSAYDKLYTSDKNSNALHPTPILGATGSRLLSGDSLLARSIESKLASVHGRPSALLFNSGYDANLSVLSSLPYREDDDAIVMDELVHNSLVMGVRMGRMRRERVFSFKHNDVFDLKRVLDEVMISSSSLASILIVVESVYSMDGDVAPLHNILDLAQAMGARVVVDEAHGLGVYGSTNVENLEVIGYDNKRHSDGADDHTIKTVPDMNSKGGVGVLAALNLESHPALLCSIHTFGKAAGCHGAVVAGSTTLISYLVNYARPFVYSTSLPPHSLVSIQQAYASMMGEVGERRRKTVFRLVRIFREELSAGLKLNFPKNSRFELLTSPSPIQAILVPGNDTCISVCKYLRNEGNFDVYPIRSPTVAKGKERIRIVLHSHNTEEQVRELSKLLLVTLRRQIVHRSALTSKL